MKIDEFADCSASGVDLISYMQEVVLVTSLDSPYLQRFLRGGLIWQTWPKLPLFMPVHDHLRVQQGRMANSLNNRSGPLTVILTQLQFMTGASYIITFPIYPPKNASSSHRSGPRTCNAHFFFTPIRLRFFAIFLSFEASVLATCLLIAQWSRAPGIPTNQPVRKKEAQEELRNTVPGQPRVAFLRVP